MRGGVLLATVAAAALISLGCEASGEGGRRVDVVQGEDGCVPAVIEASPGEKLDLRVKNETGGIYEVEGVDGTDLEEVIVPDGRTRSVGFDVPDEGGVSKIKCYVPGGVSTIIEVRAGEGAGNGGSEDDETAGAASPGAVDATVKVSLVDYEVIPDADSVDAGTVLFQATNDADDEVHELYVLRVSADGSLEPLGEIEAIEPGGGGSMALELAPGDYQLACLIVPGEAGSETDHYAKGMWTPFTVK